VCFSGTVLDGVREEYDNWLVDVLAVADAMTKEIRDLTVARDAYVVLAHDVYGVSYRAIGEALDMNHSRVRNIVLQRRIATE
jgi:DNA-directed RNA polymerase specialized sigma24 family protein